MIFAKKRIGKKGFATVIVDIIAILVFALVLILFIWLMQGKKNALEQKIQQDFIEADTKTALLSYLRSPATVNGEQSTVADMIVNDYMQNDYTNTQKSLTKLYFSEKIIQESNGWSLNIISNGQSKKYYISENTKGKPVSAEVDLPTPSNEKITVKLEIYVGEESFVIK